MSETAQIIFEKALEAVKERNYRRALDYLVEVIKLKPDMVEAWIVRGNVLQAGEDHFNALLHYDRALNFDETRRDAWNNRGIAFSNLGMWAGAEDSFRKSLAIVDSLEPHIGLANMFCTLMRLEEAAAEYRAAIALDPGCIDAHLNLGITLLGLGQWKEGFKEYETRWLNTPYPPRAFRDHVKWTGQDLNGKTILLYPEQGYGDEIMALRFALHVAGAYPGANVIVEARSPMLRLAKSIEDDQIRVIEANCPVGADYSCPLLDVPMVMDVPAYMLPWSGRRYLHRPPDAIDYWKARVANMPPGLNVGICWNSGTHMGTAGNSAKMKSIPQGWLVPLAMPGVNLISLQKPQEPITHQLPVTDWMSECHDFADTAALIEALDVVVTVDTAVAHLAGALGKPVYNLVRFSGYWPWLTPGIAGGSHFHTAWYDCMRLYRQPRLGDWQTPLAEIAERLRSYVEGKRAP